MALAAGGLVGALYLPWAAAVWTLAAIFSAGQNHGRIHYADTISQLQSQLRLYLQREELADNEVMELKDSITRLRAKLEEERAHARSQ